MKKGYFYSQFKSASIFNRFSFVLTFLLLSVLVKAQSNVGTASQITLSGSSSDFTNAGYVGYTDQGTNSVTYYIGYDNTYLYVGAFRNTSMGSTDNLTVYIDTDPNSSPTSGTGTTSGQSYNGVTGSLPFTANYNAHVEQSYQEMRSYGSSWGSTISGYNVWTTGTCREIRIPLSSIGNPVSLYVTAWMGYAGGSYANAPGTNVGGSNPSISAYWGGFGLTSSGCNPTSILSTPITDRIVNGAPASGATYGWVSATSGSNTAAGNFTIAPGGSINVNGGTLAIGSNTVTMSAASTVSVNSGTLTTTGSTFNFSGTGYINGSAAATFNNITASGALTLTTSPTINGSLQINSGGTINTNAPTYGSSSTLIYNAGAGYGRKTEWNSTSGAGYPANVTVNAGSSLDVGNATPGTAVQMSGNLDAEGGFYMDYSTHAMTAPVTVLGNVTIGTAGAISLSNSATLGGDLKVQGNWTRNGSGVFTPYSRAVFFQGGNPQTLTGVTTFAYLIISKSANNLTLNNNITVNNTLTLTTGNIVTGSNTVIMGASGNTASSSASSYIYGKQQYPVATGSSSITFAIGDASVYAPVTTAFTGVTTGGNLTATTTAGNHPQIATSGISSTQNANRYWTLTNSGIAGGTYTGTFNFVSGDLIGSPTTSTFVVRQYNGSAWNATTSGTMTSTSSQATGLSAYGDFQAGNKNSLTVTTQPSGASVCSGGNTSFTSASTSIPSTTVKWQRGISGVYSDITGSMDGSIYTNFTTGTLNITGAPNSINNYTYQAVFTNINGSVTSNPATLTVNATPTLTGTTQPSTCIGTTGTINLTGLVPSTSQTITYNYNGSGNRTAVITSDASGNGTFSTYQNMVIGDNAQTLTITSIATASCTNSSLSNNTVSLAVTGSITPSVTIAAAPSGAICSGTNVTFTATPTNGGTSPGPSYQWYKNGSPVGTNSATYANNSLVNGDQVYVSMTSGSPCASPTSANSSTITMSVQTAITGASATAGTNPICAGANLGLTAVSTTGTNIAYSWSGPSSYTSTSQNPTINSIVAGQAGVYTVSESNVCGTVTASTAAVTVQTAITGATATPSSTNLCVGSNLGLTASSTTGSNITYSWAGPAYSSSGTQNPAVTSITAGQAGVYTVTESNVCGTVTASTSSVSVQTAITGASASSSPVSPVCLGATVGLTSTSTAGTGITYSWSGPASFSSAAQNPSLGSITATQAGIYTVTESNVCTTATATVSVTISANTWNGSVSTDWNNASNWCGGVPTSATNAVIPTGATRMPVIASTGGPGFACNNLTIQSSASLTFASGYTLTVNGVLTNGGTITMTAGGTLAFASGATFTNNGTFTRGIGTVSFATGTETLNGTTAVTFNNVSLNGGVTLTTVPTIDGTLQINAGGSVTASPYYTSNSTLYYNVSYNRYKEWDATGVGTLGTTAGYPNNVTIAAGTYDIVNGTSAARAMAGNLTVTGATMNLNALNAQVTVGGDLTISSTGTLNMGSSNQPLVVNGNVSINGGVLTLSTSSGGDIKVAKNWLFTPGTFNPNARAVFFIGNTLQTISRSTAGTLSFDYIINSNTSGGIQLSSSPATSVNVNAPNGGNGLSWSASSTNFDLNGNSLYLTANQSIGIAGTDNFTSSTGTGFVTINSGTVSSVSGSGTLTFSSAVTVSLFGGMNFGSGLSTISGTLQINAGGYVTTNPATYATGSLLVYNSATTPYVRGIEWSTASGAGYPYDVKVTNNTTLDPAGTTNAGTAFSTQHNLQIDAGSAIYMDYTGHNMTTALNVGGSLTLIGNISGSGVAGGDINVAGDWINNGTANNFFPNGRAAGFNGSGAQLIKGTNTLGYGFAYLFIMNTGSGVTLQKPITVLNQLHMTSGILNTDATNTVTITNTASSGTSGGSTTSFVNGPINWTLASGLTNDGSVYSFPLGSGSTYLPMSITTVSTGGTGPVVQAQAFNSGSGGSAGTGLTTLSNTEYWKLSQVSGNYTSASVTLGRQSSITAGTVIGASSTQTGTYAYEGGTANTGTNTVANSSVIAAGYYVMSGAVAAPSITSVVPTTPAISGQANGTGYTGQTLTINGSNFPSNATVTIGGIAAVSVTYVNSSQLTAVVGQSASGSTLVVTNPTTSGSGSTSFTYLGYITNANTDWNTGSTWLGNSVPPTAATVTVNNNITVNGTNTNNPNTVTVNSGSKITFGASGVLNIDVSLTFAGTIDMTSGGNLNFTNNGTFNNNGTFTYGTGAVNFTGNAGTSTIAGTNLTNFYDVSIAGTTAGINMGLPNSNIIHSFILGTGSFVVTHAPTYAVGSTLIYNAGGGYNRNVEWSQLSGAAYPYNVLVTNNTTLNISFGTGLSNSTARAIAGTLQVNSGSTVTMNAMTSTLTTNGLTLNGTLTLSSAVGGDYIINGPWVNNGTFNPSTRAVQFNGSSAQTITGATAFDYLTINNGAGVSLNNSISVNNTLTFTSGLLTCNTSNVTLNSGAVVSGAGNAAYIQTNSTGQLKQTVGGSAVYYAVGNSTYNPVTFTNSGTSDVYGVNVLDGTYATPLNNSKVVNRRWQVTEATAGSSNLAVVLQWSTGQEAANFLAGTNKYIGFFNGSTWTQNNATQAGSNPFTFTSASNFTPSNLTTGTQYFAIGKDNAFLCATVTAPVITNTNVSCNGGSNGSVTITTAATGGTSPYTYSLNGGAYQSGTSFTGLTASTYSVVALDGNGCNSNASNSVSVTQPAVVSAPVVTAGNVTCNGAANGTVTVTTASTGGTSPYTYSLNGGTYQSGTTFSSLPPNSYSVVAKDANSCSSSTSNSVTITQPAALIGATITGTNVTCNAAADGIITVSTVATGGTSPYTYSLNSGAYQSGTSFTGLAPGAYTVVAKDANSCLAAVSNSIAITQPSVLNAATIISSNVTCNGAGDGSVTVSTAATGGTSPYTYSLNGGTYQSGTSFTGLAPTTYTVVAKDAHSCLSSASNGITITQPAALAAATITSTNVSCNGAADGTVTVSAIATGGTSPYTYSLNGGTYQSGTSFTGLTPTTYTVVAKDANSCVSSASNSLTVTQPAALAAATITSTNVSCNGAADGSVTISTAATGGTSPYTYSLNGGTYQSGTSFTGLAPNTYTVVAKDANGCLSSGSNSVTITQPAVLTATASNTGAYTAGQTISISATPAGASSYHWSGPNSFTYTGTNNPETIASATTAMTGTYTVTVTNASGCTATASTNVVVTSAGTYTWTGNTSTDWTVSTNWSPVAPVGGPNSCSDNVVLVSAANNPVISSAISVGALQINSNAQLTLNSNISVCKDWTGGSGANAIVTGTGTIIMNGSSAQHISGNTSVQEIVIDNASGISMQSGSKLDVYTALDLKTGTFDPTNGALTFKSTSTTTAAVLDNFSSGYTGTLTPTAIVKAERYYSASLTYNQHFMGSPVNSPALSQFGASGTPGFVTPKPNCDETKLASTSAYGTVFTYHEANGASCAEAQWKVETSGNAQNGLGYSLLKSGTGTLTLSGTANLNSSYTVSNLTNSGWSNTSLQGRPYGAGWQMVSNPYQATIVIDPTLNQGSFDAQVQVWDVVAGHYVLTNTIAPFQAFLVHKTNPGGTASYVIVASERTRNASTFHQLSAEQLTVVATNTSTGRADQIIVGFNQNATDNFDSQLDADKLPGNLDRHTLYSVNQGKWMQNNILHDIATTSTVPVGFEPGKTGNFTLSFNNVNTFDPTTYIYLEDRAMNVMYNIRNGDYSFTADSADNWNRFVLHFTPAAQIATSDGSCNAAGNISIQQPGTANWNYSLTDVNNATITTGTLNQNQPLNVSVAPGTYTLTLTDINNYVAVKTIVVNGVDMAEATIHASRDIVQTQQSINLSATTAGSTYQWNFGNGTSSTGAETSVAYALPGVYTVSLTETNAAGCVAVKTQQITVTAATATGLNNVTGISSLDIWSHDNKVFVDFSNLQAVDATVIIYNILGQQVSSDKVVNSTVYQREINNIEAAYLIVMVKDGEKITTKKVLVTNTK